MHKSKTCSSKSKKYASSYSENCTKLLKCPPAVQKIYDHFVSPRKIVRIEEGLAWFRTDPGPKDNTKINKCLHAIKFPQPHRLSRNHLKGNPDPGSTARK